MQQQKRYSRIACLSILYTLCFGSIILAFPKKTWYSESATDGLYLWSAKQQSSLPITIQRWQWEAISQQPTPKVEPKNTNSPLLLWSAKILKASDKKPQLTCVDLRVCEKIRFSEWYSAKEKATYYTAILEVLETLNNALPAGTNLPDALFSISLSSTVGERRGRWWSKTIAIYTKDIWSLQEFREILTHELGHIIDLWVVKWTSSDLDQSFLLGNIASFSANDASLSFYRLSWDNTTTRKASALYTDFVWGYAMTNPYEDFAESFNMYIRHQDVFRTMMITSETLQKKYYIMDRLLGGVYKDSDQKNIGIVNKNPKRRPWDSTRMSLE